MDDFLQCPTINLIWFEPGPTVSITDKPTNQGFRYFNNTAVFAQHNSGDYLGIKNFVKNIHGNIIIGLKYPKKHNFSIFKNLNWPISFQQN